VLSAAQAAKKRKLDERRALIDAKRQKVCRGGIFDVDVEHARLNRESIFISGRRIEHQMLGGKEAVDERKKQVQDRAVDALLSSIEQEIKQESGE